MLSYVDLGCNGWHNGCSGKGVVNVCRRAGPVLSQVLNWSGGRERMCLIAKHGLGLYPVTSSRTPLWQLPSCIISCPFLLDHSYHHPKYCHLKIYLWSHIPPPANTPFLFFLHSQIQELSMPTSSTRSISQAYSNQTFTITSQQNHTSQAHQWCLCHQIQRSFPNPFLTQPISRIWPSFPFENTFVFPLNLLRPHHLSILPLTNPQPPLLVHPSVSSYSWLLIR